MRGGSGGLGGGNAIANATVEAETFNRVLVEASSFPPFVRRPDAPFRSLSPLL